MSGDPEGTGGGSAGDFDDTVGTKVGGGARGDYQSQIEAAEGRGENVTFERLQQATGDAPATGGDADQAAADRAAVQGAIEAASIAGQNRARFNLGSDRVSELANQNRARFGGGSRFDTGPRFPNALTRDEIYNVTTPQQGALTRDQFLKQADQTKARFGPRTEVRPATTDFTYDYPETFVSDTPVDFDGGDVGDFSEFLPEEVQQKERERQEEIRKAVEEGRSIPGEVGLRNLLEPFGVARTILGRFTERDKEFARQASLPGNQLQTNAQGQITGVFNPRENAVYTPSSVGLFDVSGQEEAAGDLFRMQRQREEEDRESRGDNQPQTVIPPLIPESAMTAMTAPQEPVAQTPFVTGANYQPRDPVQYSYTGLPTLAPVSLQPSFRAPQQFSPAYGLSSLRRS